MFLTLSKDLLSFPYIILGETGPLFPGTSQYARFSDYLNKLLIREGYNLSSLGVDSKSLGTHSIRKGAISLVSAGYTVSPPMAAICLRATWSIWNVKDRFMHYEKAGDECVGRCVTGISSLSRLFAVSPIYFDPDGLENGLGLSELSEPVETFDFLQLMVVVAAISGSMQCIDSHEIVHR